MGEPAAFTGAQDNTCDPKDRYAKEKDIKPNLDPCWTKKLDCRTCLIFVVFVWNQKLASKTHSTLTIWHVCSQAKISPNQQNGQPSNLELPDFWLSTCPTLAVRIFSNGNGVNKKQPVLCSYPVPRVHERVFFVCLQVVDLSKKQVSSFTTSCGVQ